MSNKDEALSRPISKELQELNAKLPWLAYSGQVAYHLFGRRPSLSGNTKLGSKYSHKSQIAKHHKLTWQHATIKVSESHWNVSAVAVKLVSNSLQFSQSISDWRAIRRCLL